MFKFILRGLLVSSLVTYVKIAVAEKTDNHFFPSSIINPKIVGHYPLTESFLLKMEQIEQEIVKLPPKQRARNIRDDNKSIEERIASVSDFPQLSNILKKHNITPRDYVLGLMAFQEVLYAVMSLKIKKYSLHKNNTVSLSNLEFGQKYIDRIYIVLYY
ncbi:hypothetical protein V4P56_05880 [Bartonella sp. B35(2025)]